MVDTPIVSTKVEAEAEVEAHGPGRHKSTFWKYQVKAIVQKTHAADEAAGAQVAAAVLTKAAVVELAAHVVSLCFCLAAETNTYSISLFLKLAHPFFSLIGLASVSKTVLCC